MVGSFNYQTDFGDAIDLDRTVPLYPISVTGSLASTTR
jgi:hypothetical protein